MEPSRVLLVGDEPAIGNLATALTAQAGVPIENVRMLPDPPGAAELLDAVAKFAAGETLTIYYVGPGRLAPTGALQLVTGEGEGTACTRLLATAREHGAGTVVLVADCTLPEGAHLMFPEPLSDNEFLLASGSGAVTGALITLLRQGDPAEPPDLTLDDIHRRLSLVLPVLRRYGDPARNPVLVRNPAYPIPRPRRRRRPLVVLALVCVLAVLVGGGILLWPQSPAQPSASGPSAAKLAAAANTARANDPGLAAQLAIAAYRDDPKQPAADQLYASLNTPLDGLVANTGSAVLRTAAAADAPLAAASNQDKSLRIWNTADPAAPVLDATINAGGAGIALAPHGNLLAGTCDAPTGTCLWDLTDPHRPTPLAKLARRPGDPENKTQITSMAFSPDGSLLAAATEQGFTLLWSVADPRHPSLLTTLPNPSTDTATIAAVTFSPHGNLLAQSVLRGKTSLWNVANPSAPNQIATMDGGYASVSISPDGSLLAAVGDTDVGLWNIQQPAAPAQITVNTLAATDTTIDLSTVTFTPDGSRLAYAGSDTSDVTGELCVVDIFPANLDPQGTPATCTATGFSTFTMAATAGGALFAGGYDGAVRLWRSALHRIIEADTGDDYSWSTSQNGRLLAAPIAAPDFQPSTAVGIWDIGADPALDASLPADAQLITFVTSTTLLVATDTGAVQLWDLTDPRHPVQSAALGTATLPASASKWPLAAAVGGDRAGRLVTVLDQTGLLHLWHVTGAHAVETGSVQSSAAVTGPAGVLPDGRTAWLLTSAGVDWWDVSVPAHPTHRGTSSFTGAGVVATAPGRMAVGTLPTANGAKATLDLLDDQSHDPITVSTSITGPVSMSDDGQVLAATAVGDKSVLLWDIRDMRQPRQLATMATQSGVREIGFDRAGSRLVDWNDSAVEMWDIHDPAAPTRVAAMSRREEGINTPDMVFAAGFTAPGGPLAVVGINGITLYDVDPAKLADRLCSYTGAAITPAQWQKYAPGIPYQKPCG